ncbi:NDP-hexose 2,3-dehydratase family protein [Streptomyces sp. t39]|uniref:NDP-hexose 2,3-dehydratase family protein n=1 Tax=Streptomyces sp. t39 TaxID=1828156 RepID=UPI0011CE9322|nr:NDP-hexose 2,3-dehydratase family protein [Streptomyces sp. t39]TXS35490.1 NDP-hexose 2,3-dehydratase [Streptomyces sp. t39]
MPGQAIALDVPRMTERIAASLSATGSRFTDLGQFHDWWRGVGTSARAERIPLDRLRGWVQDAGTGDIRHESGKFFSVQGLDVHSPDGLVPNWQQPIIDQPETGILGILVKEFDGVLHCLMQAKAEPGNANGVQISPTVQATRSNFTRVHGGSAVPYLTYFQDTAPHRVLADVRQSEQGSWFYRKRNRNMIVEVTGDVEELDGFCWLTLGQLYRLLAEEDMVNMDTRTVLSCLPASGAGAEDDYAGTGRSAHAADFRASVARSLAHGTGDGPDTAATLSWITDARSRTQLTTRRVPLDRVRGWRRAEGLIAHESGGFFDVIGVEVTAVGREVRRWTQPMIRPHGIGVIAFLVREFDGVLHALVRQRTEPGFVDVTELGPTVQCTPENYGLIAAEPPAFLDEVLRAAPGRIRYDTLLSEEGGRFHHALNRYLIVESDVDVPADDPDFRWVSLGQLTALLRHSSYVNVQARSLTACLTGCLVTV